jgi:hypothetical protein
MIFSSKGKRKLKLEGFYMKVLKWSFPAKQKKTEAWRFYNWSLKVFTTEAWRFFTTEASEVTKKTQILALVNQANESSSCMI